MSGAFFSSSSDEKHTLRVAFFLMNFHTRSIGFKPGEYRGRKKSLMPVKLGEMALILGHEPGTIMHNLT